MKKILLATLLLFTFFVKAQDLNYGLTLGGNLYDIYSNSALYDEAGTKEFKLYLGGYADYGFTENLGVKATIAYNQKTLGGGESVDFNFLDISPSFKYSFGEEYSSGFFLLLGPRYSSLLKAEIEGEDVKDEFESDNFGLQLGLGSTIYEFIELELRFDYGFTALYNAFGKDRKILGGILALNLNLEKLINK
ncbi:PorT family protein [Flavobacteriaceae bacterium]|nr:PorT family protein [Flavobacteriaceae bacterium]